MVLLKPYQWLCLSPDGGGGDGGSQTGSSASVGTGNESAEVVNQQSQVEDLDVGWKEAKAKYKSQYDAEVRETINKRFKNSDAKNERSNKFIRSVASRYGVDPSNMDAIEKAFADDRTYSSQKAEEMGVTPEIYDELMTNRAKNAEYEEMRKQETTNRRVEKWRADAEKLKAMYPDFDLDAEIANNEEFRQDLQMGRTVEKAYRNAHWDEIQKAGMMYASQKSEENALNSIRANGQRPIENGVRQQPAATARVDVSNLTKAQIDDYIQRAKNGERITF